MKDYKKISRNSLWALLGIGILASILFFAGGSNGSLEVAGDFLPIPKFSTLFLVWNYILVALVCLVTLFVVIKNFVDTLAVDKKKALTSLAVVVVFVAAVVICWFAGSPEKVDIIGYEGTDNEGVMARMSDACLYLTYLLVVLTTLAVAGGRVFMAKKK